MEAKISREVDESTLISENPMATITKICSDNDYSGFETKEFNAELT